jgi:uncharacterized protein
VYSLIIISLIAYAAMAVCIALFQRRLMYHPNKHIGTPQQYGLSENMADVMIVSKDGTLLQAWIQPAKEGYPTVVYFHGNAGHIGDRAAKFSTFVDNGFGLVALSYRGFGKSNGSPDEQGIYNDARAIIDYALTKLHIPPAKLIYFGESLGSGVAVQMASERAPALLMLEAAYTSVETRSAELFPYILFVRHLVRDKYNSLAKIRAVNAPLLMIHGALDDTIPLRHGRELFNAARESKSMITYPEVNHTDYTNEQIVTPLLNTARQYKLL